MLSSQPQKDKPVLIKIDVLMRSVISRILTPFFSQFAFNFCLFILLLFFISDQKIYMPLLQLLNTNNSKTLEPCDNCNSEPIHLSGKGIPFGQYYHKTIYVSSDETCFCVGSRHFFKYRFLLMA